ncbi:MAG: tyrosine-protein phosphatase [Frisingicoccus sp.]
MFDELLAQEEEATLWHCTAGKDRAGIASILVLSALDVPEAVIEADYFKVNDFLRDENEKLCRSVEDKMNNHSIHDGLMKMFIVHSAYLDRMLHTIKIHYGTMSGYLEKGLGLSRDKKELLKQLYLS